jgi:hypothetical protein
VLQSKAGDHKPNGWPGHAVRLHAWLKSFIVMNADQPECLELQLLWGAYNGRSKFVSE